MRRFISWLTGYHNERDDGVAADVPSSVARLRQAAQRGDPDAMMKLGVMLLRGDEGVAKDVPAAATLFKQAAEFGGARAMCTWAHCREHGIGTRRDVAGAFELYERAGKICDISDMHWIKTMLAKLLLSDDVGELRNPARAAGFLEEALQQNPTYGPTLHELAVLYSAGEDGVPQNRQRAALLHSLAASKASYEGVGVSPLSRILIEAGEGYVEVVEEVLRKGYATVRTCLLLTLGGGGRGKTSTMNSLRGMPFVARHEPTEMAALSKFVTEPGVRGLGADMIAEFDFSENSLRGNASRVDEQLVSDIERHWKSTSAEAMLPLELSQAQGSSHEVMERPHADVIERTRRPLRHNVFPVGFKGSVVQVWDMAGQSQYEMAHSMVIARGSVLVFVTDLERVADEGTRESEVGLLCYWMQLAHIIVPDVSRTRAFVVGTRKSKANEDTLEILEDCVANQLSGKVYDSWIKESLSDRRTANIPKFIAIENSESQNNPKDSGLEELEHAVKAAGDAVVMSRGAVPLRWLAFVDKLEREYRSCARIYFSREDVRDVSRQFPGFTDDEAEREKDVLEGLRCFASMGRLVLFERGDEEWYVFMHVEKIIQLVGKVTGPEKGLRKCLRAEDVRGLKQGRISQGALFTLWDGYEEEEKRVMLKLLCEFDLIMLLEGGKECIENGCAPVGVPALMPRGWDNFEWGRRAGEKDLEVATQFMEALPNGLIGGLVAHLHRTLAFDGANVHGATRRPGPMVRADAVLLSVRDGSRMFVGFKGAERQLCWRFRGLHPIRVAQECLREVENLLDNPSRLIDVDRTHAVVLDCDSGIGGCGASGSVQVKLSKDWVCEGSCNGLPADEVFCEKCIRPWSNTEIAGLLWPEAQDSVVDVGGMRPVMAPRKYKVFISHAGPDKLTLAEPLYKHLAWHNVHSFLDMEGLQIHEDTAPEAMVHAMREACIGIFILSPEFAAREWTLKELRHFLERSERCGADGVSRPVLLPVFYRLSISECWTIYREDSEHRELLRKSGFFRSVRQAKCSTEEAEAALQKLTRHSGLEVQRIGGGEDLSSAAVVAETGMKPNIAAQEDGYSHYTATSFGEADSVPFELRSFSFAIASQDHIVVSRYGALIVKLDKRDLSSVDARHCRAEGLLQSFWKFSTQ